MCKILILKGFVPDSERGFFVRLGGEILATADSLPTPASKLAGDPGCGNDRKKGKTKAVARYHARYPTLSR